MKRFIRLLFKLIIAIIVLYVPFSWLLTQFALYHRPRIANFYYSESPTDYGMAYEDVQLQSGDGTTLSAWHMQGENGAAVVVVHGYRSVKTKMIKMSKPLYDAGYTLLLLDLRAHGDSEGNHVTFGVEEQEDVHAAVAWLMAQPHIDAERVGVMGESMGGATVILAAADNPDIKAVATQGAFASMRSTISTYISPLQLGLSAPMARLMMYFGERKMGVNSDDYAPINVIDQISPRPIFIMQGGSDPFVNPKSGNLLYDAAEDPKELWFEPDLAHTNFPDERPEAFGRRITAFFDQALLND